MSQHVDRLVMIMAQLRDPDSGCPWDIAQTFRTIAPYTLEEAHEVVDAIERGDLDELRGELGDLLLQVIFHARMAQEQGAFTLEDVAEGICDKMIRRHPHVFGENAHVLDSQALHAAWEQTKAVERSAKRGEGEHVSALDDVALALPALVRGQKIQKRAARVGFDWPEVAQVSDKLHEELAELDQARLHRDRDAIEDEMGDVLFSAVNLARHLEVDAETALRRATKKFETRFRQVEALATERELTLSELDIAALESLWQEAKQTLS
jgi:MazG family protein